MKSYLTYLEVSGQIYRPKVGDWGLGQTQQLHSLLLFKGWGQNQAHALNMVDVAT